MAEKKYIGKPGKQDDPCWKGYEMVGMKKKGGRKVPNCVPEAREIIEKAKAKLKKDPLTGAKIDSQRFILPEDKVRTGTLAQRAQAYRADKAKKAGANLKMDPDTGTPDHFTAAQRRKKGLDEADSKKYPRKGFPEEGDYGYHPNPGLKPQESDKDEDMDKAYKKATEAEGRKPLNAKVLEIAEKRGLWDNIHAKRKRIKAGSGERMRKPGSEGAPSAADLKASQTEEVEQVDEYNNYRKAGKDPFAQRKQNIAMDRAEKTGKMPGSSTSTADAIAAFKAKGGKTTKLDTKGNMKEELGKSNEWGTDALRKKYAAMTPGQESMAADKIPSFDPRYDNVTTQHLGLHPFREGYLAEISARGAEARAKFQAKVRQTLADPANIKRAKKTLAKKKETEKAKEAPHLVMQLRKAVSIGSKVHFQDGSHHAISGNHADIFMSKYNSAKSSIEKEALQKRAHKSHSEFMRTIAEEAHENCGTPDCCQTCDTAEMGTHHVDSYEAHRGSGDQISPVISHDDEDIRFQDFDEEAFEKELEADVLALSWDDLVDLYDEDEIEYDESPEAEEEGEDLEEGITPAGRLKKKFNAMRTKSRRTMARNIAIKRVSSPEKLKSRSVRAARRMVYKRLLRNRDISSVSSAEKTRLEAQIKRMAPMVARLSVRVMPAVRKLEQSRIKNSRTKKRK